jgi:Ser/Thr protein kinase RdoA (MazF antagonist)
MNDNVLNEVAKRYGISAGQLTPLSGGHFTSVYAFRHVNKEYVLRIVPPNEEMDLESMRSVLEWMGYLAGRGVCVPSPIPSVRGELAERVDRPEGAYLGVVIEKALGILAEELPFEQWDGTLFQAIGRQVGRMHAASQAYTPSAHTSKRLDWDQAGSEFHPGLLPETLTGKLRQKFETVQAAIAMLPKDRAGYGLIHADLHFANFLVDAQDRRVTIIDFDDCAYGWYMMDTALLLFDILVVYPRGDREGFAACFLENYWRGYLDEMPVSAFWAGQLPVFLKLLELNIFAKYRKYDDPEDHTSWLGKFYSGRANRIEQDLPYVSIDFERILARAETLKVSKFDFTTQTPGHEDSQS